MGATPICRNAPLSRHYLAFLESFQPFRPGGVQHSIVTAMGAGAGMY